MNYTNPENIEFTSFSMKYIVERDSNLTRARLGEGVSLIQKKGMNIGVVKVIINVTDLLKFQFQNTIRKHKGVLLSERYKCST